MIWTKESYREYLRSPHWEETRAAALEVAGFRCRKCRASNSRVVRLEVHHLTYERIGAELPSDLEVLCRECHGFEHGITPPAARTVADRWEHISWILPRVLERMGFIFAPSPR